MSLPRPSSPSLAPADDQGQSRRAGHPSDRQCEFSPHERSILLRLAHDAILAALEQREISLDPPSAHLAEPRGVFTTLHLNDELRGCVGYVLPMTPLYRAVAETACAAAFDDTRFYPVSAEEVPNLTVELSILSRPVRVSADAVEIGRHGLLISRGGYRGLLLPQVPVEHGWDRLTFLEQTCRKAGLPLDAWRTGATIEVFTAEVFGDREQEDRPARSEPASPK